jgi:UDP:flavonoid glycosyltransferase YjiC (YdhE family)
MLITLASGGSRGDCQPYVALARGFKRAGHRIRFIATQDFAPLVENEGFDCRYLGIDVRSILESTVREQGTVQSKNNPLEFFSFISKIIGPIVEQSMRDVRESFSGSDAFVVGTIGDLFGPEAYDWLEIPYCFGFLQPLTRTAAFEHSLCPALPSRLHPIRSFYNKFTYLAVEQLIRTVARGHIHRALRKMGACQPSVRNKSVSDHLILYAFSPSVVSRPNDWPVSTQVTGYWFLDQAATYHPPTGLVDFLNAGAKPVGVGFGSMYNRDPKATTDLVIEALRRSRQRGVLISGWGGMARTALPDFVYVLEEAPHDWLFPRLAAVVHHCGAGTTAAGLRAGVPTVPVPFATDQHFWARRLHGMDVATRPIPRPRLTADALGEAIALAVRDPELRRNSAALSACIRAEDGVARAVEIAEHYFQSPGGRPRLNESKY